MPWHALREREEEKTVSNALFRRKDFNENHATSTKTPGIFKLKSVNKNGARKKVGRSKTIRRFA